MLKDNIRIGIIGTGFGVTQIESFKGLEGCTVVGLCGRNRDKTESIAASYSVPKVYAHYREMMADPEVDLVCISTPNNTHKDIFSEAVQSGKHILVEKSAGMTSTEIAEMEKMVSDKTNLFIGVDHPMRLNPVVTEIVSQARSGKLGWIHAVHVNQFTNFASTPGHQWGWRDSKSSGGGQILLMATHLIDLARFITGMPGVKGGEIVKQIVTSVKSNDGESHTVDAEEQFSGTLIFDNGCAFSTFNTQYSFGYKDFEILVFGTRGILMYNDKDGLLFSGSNSESPVTLEIPDALGHITAGRSFVSRSFKFLAERTVKNIRNGTYSDPDVCSLREAKDNLYYLEKFSAPDTEVLRV